jgi:hypothetical protein
LFIELFFYFGENPFPQSGISLRSTRWCACLLQAGLPISPFPQNQQFK